MWNMNIITPLLAQNGWTVECEGPLEIRHIETGSFASGLAADAVVTSLQSFTSPIQAYEDAFALPPRSSGWPMNCELYKQFIDEDVIVTFLALVPLYIMVNGGVDGLHDYCEQAFTEASMTDTEFRAVPSDDISLGSWDERFNGDVAVQVTCRLVSDD